MEMIDAHVHCWDTTVVDDRWLEVLRSLPNERLLEDSATAGTPAVSSVILVEEARRHWGSRRGAVAHRARLSEVDIDGRQRRRVAAREALQ